MSSLRPLATITLLAVVGVVLYMKINETEPVVPEGVGEWSNQLEIGAEGGAAVPPGVGTISAAPALEAPPFSPSAPAGQAAAAPVGDAAPAWKPEPLLSSKTEVAAEAKDNHATHDHAHDDEESSPVARTAEVPEMPPLPESNSTAKSSDAAPPAVVAVPFVNTPGGSPPSASAIAEPAATTPAPAPAAEASPNPYAAAAATAGVAAAAAASTDPAPVAAAPAPAAGAAPAANAPAASEPITPTDAPSGSTYASTRVAVQADLDRGELNQALIKLSEWYGDPSLTAEETQEVETLLGQLAGDVIYEGPPAHRLLPRHIVATGETLETISQKYNVPWQLLAKINRIADPAAVQVGQELKVVQGPFSAIVDLGKRRMTLMLDRSYAGRFSIELDPTASIEEGSWKVDQKLLTPIVGGVYGQPAGAKEDRGLLLTSTTNPTSQPAMLRGPGTADQVSAPPVSRVIRFNATDVNDVYDILSVGSTITVRR
ncbi:LysM peptidoglycan-binding domain-containing protein [Lacipirellula limnantheis]|uniref:LysM domain protein n=1 Tax=Lacipirellula limnantheis TaxID=2528024 RepID=A0A517U5H1_9BACT|nr:LysM domain-containing protein [Lacipirellula limnantheis]QDT75882.1 LysM domain protein [Lacipirellula limnantheis]